MAIQAVIWDLGGVLVRTEDYEPREDLAKRLGITRRKLEDIVFNDDSGLKAQLGKISIEDHWSFLSQKLDLPSDQVMEVEKQFFAGDRLDTRLVDKIRELKQTCKTSLLSNAFSNLRYFVTQVWGFADAFDDMVISAEVGLVKPDPRIYRLTIDRLGVIPQEAVFIDDFSRNIESAREFGLEVIHFKNPDQALLELDLILEGDE